MGVSGGRDGGQGSWSYHEQTGSSSCSIGSSSSSGTIVSTTTYTSSSSRLSSVSMEEAIMHLDYLEIHCGGGRIKDIKSLVLEFFAAPSANCSGDMSVLERWFTELGIPWVLHLTADHGASAGRELEHAFYVRSWIRALAQIMRTICSTASLFPDREPEPEGDLFQQFPRFIQETVLKMLFPDRGSMDLPIICEEEVVVEDEDEDDDDDEPEAESVQQPSSSRPDQLQIAHFFQETMSKMLGFVDFIANEVLVTDGVLVPQVKLSALLPVHVAMSNALSRFLFRLHSSPSAEVERIESEMVSLLSAKDKKAREAIWRTLEEIRTGVLELMEDSSSAQSAQASSDIHRLTWSVMADINFLRDNYATVAPIISEAATLGKYAPQIGRLPPFESMIIELTSCLEEKLVDLSRSFTDHGLRFLFLLNNSYLISESLRYDSRSSFPATNTKSMWQPYFPHQHVNVAALLDRVQGHMEGYLQVSWVSVLCLLNPTPLCYGKNYSPLPKFESEFQKTYIAQKLWKVPDPELRKRLRKAITEKIIPGYTKYIEDNKFTTPRFSPQEMQEMLQELFEG